ncbi:2-oxo acid dehydrogenase subunit E2 [Arthrobacter jiangjiafuii]|uniref:Dihydrolipoamide acetyltransferase component of pyruvate dehydrogenase complex n=1 Tax=Arthrobacter jiangjiafuii TaxID=2817475 RepID=A0A975R0P6_9MICC|nr:dihydrolipoamide acetyltransferase family protein [Arthrobacter jiangjiafuii]MBP3042625.1 2-oxo acid dehydrogenase subunit E2 [Arthrobacter jiangjiafuii]QWC09649.1 2-oxo acid dehydrogenase subunit E2 [Arthrobacter jiangjiafuii]
MSVRTFLLPDLGEGLTEAELVTWLVAVGDEILVDQPVAEVETAKSLVEVPSPYAGTVAVLHGEAGQTLDVGRPLISVAPAGGSGFGQAPDAASEAVGDTGAAADTGAAPVGQSDPAGEAYRQEEKAGSGNVLIGYGTPGGLAVARRTRRSRNVAAAPAGPVAMPAPAAAPAPLPVPAAPPAEAPRCISPLVRKLARDGGVRLGGLSGSGANGLILRSDVEAALATAMPAGSGTSPSIITKTDTAAVDPRTGLAIASQTPVKGLRKTVAANLAASRSNIPEATVWVDVDATALLELRADLKRRDPGNTPGLLAFLARFVVAGLAKFPELNARFDQEDSGAQITAYDGVNLGFAAQTDRGLVVPSVRRADTMSARQLDVEIRRLTASARNGKATPAELSSGTFTLNNYGVFGVDGSAAIINYPESAILGVGRIIDKPWVVDGALAVRKMTELTLVFDHRICDGGTAGGFLRYVADAIENPGSVLADL